jgi:hypothetical protein
MTSHSEAKNVADDDDDDDPKRPLLHDNQLKEFDEKSKTFRKERVFEFLVIT